MTETRMDMLGRLSRSVKLRELRPIEMVARFIKDAPSPGAAAIALRTKAEQEVGADPAGFVVVHKFDVRFREASLPDDQHFVEFQYKLVARYETTAPFTDEELKLFVGTNGMVHAWPFLRAFVANSSGQLGLQGVPLLPPFLVQEAVTKLSGDPPPSDP